MIKKGTLAEQRVGTGCSRRRVWPGGIAVLLIPSDKFRNCVKHPFLRASKDPRHGVAE